MMPKIMLIELRWVALDCTLEDVCVYKPIKKKRDEDIARDIQIVISLSFGNVSLSLGTFDSVVL